MLLLIEVGAPFDRIGLPLGLAVAIELAVCILAALVFGKTRARAVSAFALAMVAMLAPLAAPLAPHVIRLILGLVGLLCMLRIVDLARDKRAWSPRQRVWFVLTPFDTRRATFGSPAIDPRGVAAVFGYSALALAAIGVLVSVQPSLEGASRFFVRYLAGLVLAYSGIDAVVALIRTGYLAAGVRTPEIQRAPILSRSIQEFWGERWNRPVHQWLERHCFLPFARRRMAIVGVGVAFLASTLIHVYITLLGAGVRMALVMGSFFVVQGVLLVVERRLGVARFPAPLARAWTVFWLVGTSPLFVEPMLRMLDF